VHSHGSRAIAIIIVGINIYIYKRIHLKGQSNTNNLVKDDLNRKIF